MSESSESPKSLGFDLRARIAIIQQGHIFCITECSCGHRFAVSDTSHTAPFADWKTDAEWEWAQHVADAVIAELGLRPQRHELLTRYITNWTHAENTK